MTKNYMVLIAARYETNMADAMRRACGVYPRRHRDPYAISGDEYDNYRRRLAAAYSGE